jgi:hypothetical protein
MSTRDAERTISIVEELTDVYTKAAYPQFNRRRRKDLENQRLQHTSAEAQTIKYADIIDNGPETVKADPDFAKRFLFEYRTLLKKLTKGNGELRKTAIEIIDESIGLVSRE